MSFAEGSTGLVSVVKGFKGSKGALKGSKMEKAHEGPSVERLFHSEFNEFCRGFNRACKCGEGLRLQKGAEGFEDGKSARGTKR